MAGEGSRFTQAGYTFPKPLIDVDGRPMIQVVIDSLPDCDAYTFLCREDQINQYNMKDALRSMLPGKDVSIVEVSKLTEGAACTALLAKEIINNGTPLLIANSDQYVEYDKRNFDLMRRYAVQDGIIFTFNACHPKWSFTRLDHTGKVIEVAEKRPISNVATCGIYYFQRGSDFVEAAESMIAKDIRTNGEFYIAPVYNEIIGEEKYVLPFFVDRMAGLGTPEDLESFLNVRR
jgi:dTDP-glucose pyrophosphorylase